MIQLITILLTCAIATSWPISRYGLQYASPETEPYAKIQTLQDRVINSDSSQLIKSFYEHVLTFNASPSGSLHSRLNEISQAVELNLATVAILESNFSSIQTLQHFTRLQRATKEINSHLYTNKNRFSPSYWALKLPFQFTLKSTIAYRRWQLHNLQRQALHHGNGSLLLQETFKKVRESSVLLEASSYMLSQLSNQGFQRLYHTCQPILMDFFQPLLQKPLSQDGLYSLQDQLKSLVDDDLSRHRYREIALGSFLVILLASCSISLLPLMCNEYHNRILLTRCIFYLIGMTWFHMMVFFLYFCKLRRDFEV